MNHKNKTHETPPDGVELTRKEMADLFGVSNETIKRRTVDGHLNPVAENSRVLIYGVQDVQGMIKAGYRLDPGLAKTHGLPASPLGENVRTKRVPDDQVQPPAPTDRHEALRKVLGEHRNDLISQQIIMRFLATLILSGEFDPT